MIQPTMETVHVIMIRVGHRQPLGRSGLSSGGTGGSIHSGNGGA
jgi:hypothetical protein